MRKLIINADDLGYSLRVNSEIERLIFKGLVTSSTLMANGPAFEDGVRIAREHPEVSVGVHLNLIEFKPLTNFEIFRNYGLIDSNDDFIEGAIFVYPINDELKEAIFQEWDEQISRVKQRGILPSHIDSHEHTHAIGALQDILISLMKKHEIIRVRRCCVPSIRLILKDRGQSTVTLDKSKAILPPKRNVIYRRIHLFVVKYKMMKWNRKMRRIFQMADSFYAFRYFKDYRSILNLGKRDSVVELMCHPGQPAFDNETIMLDSFYEWCPAQYELSNYTCLK